VVVERARPDLDDGPVLGRRLGIRPLTEGEAGQRLVGFRGGGVRGSHTATLPPAPRVGYTSTPGLRIPSGSRAALAARRARANGSGRCPSYQGRWSRPTAWWWVIVPPLARIAALTAAF